MVPDLKRRLPGRGVWVTATRAAVDEAVKRKAFARGFKREVRAAPDLGARGRAAAGARGARCARHRPQGRPGRDRLRQDRSGARRRSGGGDPAGRGRVRRTGRARSRPRRPGAKPAKIAGEIPDNRGVYDGAIGFGIGAVKCGTCCPARRPSEQRVPRALPEPRTLPDHCSGRTRRGIARRHRSLRHVTRIVEFRIGCEWLLIPRAPARRR